MIHLFRGRKRAGRGWAGTLWVVQYTSKGAVREVCGKSSPNREARKCGNDSNKLFNKRNAANTFFLSIERGFLVLGVKSVSSSNTSIAIGRRETRICHRNIQPCCPQSQCWLRTRWVALCLFARKTIHPAIGASSSVHKIIQTQTVIFNIDNNCKRIWMSRTKISLINV